jgi:hypothetical protein
VARPSKAVYGGLVGGAAKAAAASAPPEWDFVAILLRQWNMQVDVTLGAQGKTALGKRSAARTTQPLAVHIQGTFGIHGQQRCADESITSQSGVKLDVPSSSTAPLRTNAAVGAQPAVNSSQSMGRDSQRQPFGETHSAHIRNAQASPGHRQRSVPSASASGHAASKAEKAPVAGSAAAITPPAGCVIHVDIILKAFVPELTPEGAVQLLRIVDRVLVYEKYNPYWSQRPAVSVTRSPAAWWQHAGRAVLNDCRLVLLGIGSSGFAAVPELSVVWKHRDGLVCV